jgi:ribosomal protein S18 acetylase RimI-like enzyme
MIYRPATLADAPALAKLGADTFVAAFEHLYAPEDLAAFLAKVHNPDAVGAEIAGGSCTHCLVEDDGVLIAFCKLRHPTKFGELSGARDPIELAQLYALPGHTGAGIGARLMDWALGVAREGDHDAVLLSVYAENFGAQRFYQRYGFAHVADITFQVGNHCDPEFLYELRLGESA